MRYILIALGIYFAYQLLFNLIIPIFKAGRTIKKGFSEMQSRMQEQMNQQQQPQKSAAAGNAPKRSVPEGEYIDFEELK